MTCGLVMPAASIQSPKHLTTKKNLLQNTKHMRSVMANFTLEQTMKDQRGRRVIALLFL
jgi:hypothetical protein